MFFNSTAITYHYYQYYYCVVVVVVDKRRLYQHDVDVDDANYWQPLLARILFHCCFAAVDVVDVVFECKCLSDGPPFRICVRSFVRSDADELVGALTTELSRKIERSSASLQWRESSYVGIERPPPPLLPAR